MKVPCFLQWQEGEWEDHRSGSVWLREINGDEFTTMFLPYFGNMVQRVVTIWPNKHLPVLICLFIFGYL
uniref:Uncharacterized protein n=1 Tax=Aegilops tauschii subsp. strangulata TaxID=200361 RepID=A0A452Z0W6_AEGTS